MSAEVNIFNIQHYCVHDGPGTRTTVFMKGCNMRCGWCSNPESQSGTVDLLYDNKLCLHCGACVKACPLPVVQDDGAGLLTHDKQVCSDCLSCVRACKTKALSAAGETRNVSEIMKEINRDAIFYRRTGGGATLSGGEPLLQPEAAAELLQRCRSLNISTCIETCMNVPWANVELLLPLADHFFCDIKMIDDERHRRYTGNSNDLILDNISRLIKLGADLTVRYPLIPTVNDSDSDIIALAGWLRAQGKDVKTELMPYHRLGIGKYQMLGRSYAFGDLRAPGKQEVQKAAELLRSLAVNCIN
ncbi:MAG: glycyl-radical enzyme activating protein [Firmicutes bacterium]|nr:glycyl-radical enzyme activating protein [Bacillota bacterium]